MSTKWTAAVAVVTMAVAAVAAWHQDAAGRESTDDAKVAGETVPVRARASGTVAELDVEEDQFVRAGTLLARLDTDLAEAHLAQAEAELTLAQANAEAAEAEERLTVASVRTNAARSLAAGDAESVIALAGARARAARAQMEKARLALDLADLDLTYTKIVAPQDGVVSNETIEQGDAVAQGQPVLQLLTSSVWVTANFKDGQTVHMRRGQPVTIEVDASPSMRIHGEVEALSGRHRASFSPRSSDDASVDPWTVDRRVPVRIRVASTPAGVVLRPGMRVEVTVDTRSRRPEKT
jgi:membrane fusion protein (multidrug efflux system)